MQTKVKMVHPSGHCCSVCPSPRKYFCHSHSMIFCSKCFIRVHSGCIWEELRDSKETKDALREVKTVIERVKHRAKEMDIQKYVKDFWDEIKMIQNDYGDLEKRIVTAEEKDNVCEYGKIIKDIIELQKRFVNSKSFTEYAKYKELIDSSDEDDPNERVLLIAQSKLKKKQELLSKELTIQKQKEVDRRVKEIEESLIKENKLKINQLEHKILEEQNKNKELSVKYANASKELKLQAEKFEEAKQEYINTRIEEEHKQKERELQEKKELDQLQDCTKLFNTINLIILLRDLEKIVKASCNCERLVIRYSDILCSSALDFSTDSDYKTKSLSFYNCGYNDNRKSSWLTDSPLFKNILEGIGKCGLKLSLQTIDIEGCKLDKSKVQEMFNKNKMAHISVVDNGGKDPMTE